MNPETVADNSAQKIVYPELPRHVALRAEPADALVSSGGNIGNPATPGAVYGDAIEAVRFNPVISPAADGYPLVLGADDVVTAGAANGGPVMARAAEVRAVTVAANNNSAIPGIADDELPIAEDNASVEESLRVEGANDTQWTLMSAFAGGLLTFPARMKAHLTMTPDPRFFAHFMKLLQFLHLTDPSALLSITNVFTLNCVQADLLTAAAEGASLELFRQLVALKGGGVDEKDSRGWTPIAAACFAERLDIIELLHFGFNANIASHTSDGLSPLMLACEAYLTRSQRLLMTQNLHNDTIQAQPGGEVSIYQEDFSALCNEFAMQSEGALDRCFIGARHCRREESQTDHPVAQNKWLLFHSLWDDVEVLCTWIQMNCMEARIWTLHREVLQQCDNVISHCQEYKRLCTRWFNEGWPEGERLLMEYVAIEGQSKGIRLMCNVAEQQQNAGDNLQVQQQHGAAALAAHNTDMRVIYWLFEHGLVDINATDNRENTALHNIIARGSFTYLHRACRNGDTSWLSEPWIWLLNVNAQDNDGHTPLHLAAQMGDMSVVRALIARGANQHLVDDNDKTAADLAKEFGFPLVAEEIIQRMSNQLED